MKLKLHRPSPAMAVAGVALVSSFAAPAFADDVARVARTITGNSIKNGTVTGADLKNRTIRAADIARGAVGGAQVKTGSITGSDVRNESLTGDDVKDGSVTGTEIAEGTLGTVQSAATAATAATAGSAGNAASADSAKLAERALKADDAATLGGKSADAFVPAGRVVAGKAEMKVGDEPKTVVEFNGYAVTGQCTAGESGPVANMVITNVSAGTSAAQTWWSAEGNSTTTDNEFDNGDSLTLVRNTGSTYQAFKWEQYGPLNLFNPANGTYLWGGAGAAGVNVGDHDCVLVFRSLLA